MSVGDWIRFMHSGRLVIDEIAYLIPRASWDSTIEAMTVSHGRVRLDDGLERRPQQAQPCAVCGRLTSGCCTVATSSVVFGVTGRSVPVVGEPSVVFNVPPTEAQEEPS